MEKVHQSNYIDDLFRCALTLTKSYSDAEDAEREVRKRHWR
jgi:hypothetical protein